MIPSLGTLGGQYRAPRWRRSGGPHPPARIANQLRNYISGLALNRQALTCADCLLCCLNCVIYMYICKCTNREICCVYLARENIYIYISYIMYRFPNCINGLLRGFFQNICIDICIYMHGIYIYILILMFPLSTYTCLNDCVCVYIHRERCIHIDRETSKRERTNKKQKNARTKERHT